MPKLLRIGSYRTEYGYVKSELDINLQVDTSGERYRDFLAEFVFYTGLNRNKVIKPSDMRVEVSFTKPNIPEIFECIKEYERGIEKMVKVPEFERGGIHRRVLGCILDFEEKTKGILGKSKEELADSIGMRIDNRSRPLNFKYDRTRRDR